MKKDRFLTALVVATILLETACSRLPRATSETQDRTEENSPSPNRHGSLKGLVLFDGPTLPKSTQVKNTTDPDLCGTVQSLNNVIISTKNRGIKNVIVALRDVPSAENHPPEPTQLTLDNRHCQFKPHVAVLTSGSTVEAINSDAIFHSVHFYGLFDLNLSLAPNQSKLIRRFKRPGFYVVKCDLHGWMQAFFRVDDHPFHSVSSEEGKFEIRAVPLGSYTLEAWHEYFGKREVKVNIEADRPSLITIRYQN